MTNFRLPKAKPKPKNYANLPWTENFRCKYPAQKVKELLKDKNLKNDDIIKELTFYGEWDRDKAELVKEFLDNEVQIVKNDQEVNLVINIPFCAWRCFNCNNVMYDKIKEQDIYPYFFDALLKEIVAAKQIIKNKYYIVKNIVFTGNLFALENEKIEELFRALNYTFSTIIVEMGSPKFVTEEKLDLLKKYNVNRIIINELTFNTQTLRKLCRRFEFKDLYDAYKLFVGYGFEISFELSVGLLDEKELKLSRNLELACELGASNIDLYAVRCPYITEPAITNKNHINEIRALLDFANRFMLKHGYKPYFLYCSEIENGCFENVGWSIPGKENKFFVDKISKFSTTIGCGTSAENVLVKNIENKKEFLNNPYDISQYVFGINEIIEKKNKFFE